MILGIDVGGTTVKFGTVTPIGEINNRKVFDTKQWVDKDGFVESLKREIGIYLKEFPQIRGVGMGFPGLISADRKKVIKLPNIPSVVDTPVVEILNSAYPQLVFRIENDAKCAAIGEFHFGENKDLDDFILLTLGTGVGGGVIINKKLLIGGRGNATELGHILTSNGKTLENNVGISHLIEYAKEQLKNYKGKSMLEGREITPKSISECASMGDKLCIDIWNFVGRILGETLVGIIRTLDVNNILIGGGISGAFDFFLPEMKRMLHEYLPTYYTDQMQIRKAFHKNDAGLLGAAGLLIEGYNK